MIYTDEPTIVFAMCVVFCIYSKGQMVLWLCNICKAIVNKNIDVHLATDITGGVLNFELGTDVRPEVSTTTL